MYVKKRFSKVAGLTMALIVGSASLTLVGCKSSGVNMQGMVSSGMGLAKAVSLTDEDMQQIGDQTIAQLDSSNQVASSQSAYAKRLAQLAAPWQQVEGISLEYKVYMDPEVNAFAVPNGSIRFYSGLMDEMTDDEVRYVIAHEIGHVVLGHSKTAFQTAYAASSARQAVAASGNSAAAALTSSELGDLGEKLINAQFSQRNENEADDFAIKLMQASNYNAAAAVSALRKIESKYGNHRSLFSSHPASGDRAKRLAAQLDIR
ncbi:M48 family metalloprotease [Nitrincola sp.]|uniref:M48 family metalloprotease n=1 Tax=Nitrincola sp. TaxID=1926584 RepID=UPI003A93C5EF